MNTPMNSSNDPLSNISEPHAHDVLCGRGAGITKHEGNKRWRELIRSNRQRYTALPRNQRPIIAESIVRAVRSLDPPGRFLTKDAASQLWYDIGDERATEKTAQAMRDSKKNSKESKSRTPSPSPVPSPAASPMRQPAIADTTSTTQAAAIPKSLLARPEIVRRDDTFSQRMEGFAFLESPLLLQREPSATILRGDLMMTDSQHNNKPTTKPSPHLAKPTMERNNTFDKRLEHLDLSIHTSRPSRTDSVFSIGSMDMLAEDEWQALEASCGMPSQQQQQQQPRLSQHGQFYSDVIQLRNSDSLHHRISGMSIEEHDDNDDVMMEDIVATTSRPSFMYTKRTDPDNHDQFHWSF